MRTTRRWTTKGAEGGVRGQFEWGVRDVSVSGRDNGHVRGHDGLEFPKSWSDNSVYVTADRYFGPEESSLWDCVERVASVYRNKGIELGYFDDDESAEAFYDELCYGLVAQHFSFNSPVWFNVGHADRAQQVSACFILSVNDEMESILNSYSEEGMIFKGGSGSGLNVSRIRGSGEGLSGGGEASGPVSFMRAADTSASTIKSGGRTRRAARMVVMDVDHPDIEEFVECKVIEEQKAADLRAAGWKVSPGDRDEFSVFYQNANHSVKVSDEFMKACSEGRSWPLVGRTDGNVMREVDAKALLGRIAQAAWDCADPGIMFSGAIDRQHTLPGSGGITSSNPCGEYLHLDNTSCNLASIRLTSFLNTERRGSFDGAAELVGYDIDALEHAVGLLGVAMDISVSFADFPTETIGAMTRRCRPLGIGITDLGALLMRCGIPYDSDAGRAGAAALMSLVGAKAHLVSAQIAARSGPHSMWGNETNREKTLSVMAERLCAAEELCGGEFGSAMWDAQPIAKQAAALWAEALRLAEESGMRNSQLTAIAPTGTISIMMDCDTTGIEPELALSKEKLTAEGAVLSIVNRSVPDGLKALGYGATERDGIERWVEQTGSVAGAPGLEAGHEEVFSCALGHNSISSDGHLRMMAAMQPFVCGGISKTVNLDSDVSASEIEDVYIKAWELDLKAVSVYRDGCKDAQPLSVAGSNGAVSGAVRRDGTSIRYRIGGEDGELAFWRSESDRLDEIKLSVGDPGSAEDGLAGALSAVATAAVRRGVPVSDIVNALEGRKFLPAGVTDDPDVRFASSHVDYAAKRLALDYQRASGGAAQGTAGTVRGRACPVCGHRGEQAGTCLVCRECGYSSGVCD